VSMRVVTDFFSIQSDQLVPGYPVGGDINDSTPASGMDTIIAYREWLGMHEGAVCIAIPGNGSWGQGPTHGKVCVKARFSTVLIDESGKRC